MSVVRTARRLLRHAQQWIPPCEDGTVILCYHLVGGGTTSPVDLPVDVFQRQMEELAETASVVSLEDAVAATEQGEPAPRGRPRVVITFDDAYANFSENAWPILDALGLEATLFVPIGFLDGTSPSPIGGLDLPPMPWSELRELTTDGRLHPGSHTWTHPDLRTLPDDAVHDELYRSRATLEERLEVEISSFCYPRALWSEQVERHVGETYELATVGGGRRLHPGAVHRLRLERISLRSDMPTHLGPLLTAKVWLEEWLADQVRRRR